MLMPVSVAAISLISIVYDAIIVVVELMFLLVFIRFVFFNGEWLNYALFTKIITFIFTLLVILILVAIFLSIARFT